MADAWTETEKSNLLLQIIAQVKPEKGGINWDLIQIEGRTKKACQNTWGKFIAQHKQQQALGGDGETMASPVKATPTRKRKAKKEKVEDKIENSGEDSDATPLAKKPRARARKPKLNNDIDVLSPQTMEEASQLVANDGEMKPKIEHAI